MAVTKQTVTAATLARTIIDSRHFEQRVAKNADQAEFQAILAGSAAFDAGLYDDEVAGVLDDFENASDEAIGLDWHKREVAKESGVGSIHEEVTRRIELLGRSYPFRLSNNAITHRPSGSGLYEFCLAASMAKDISRKPYAYIPRAFEKVSAEIVGEFVGFGAIPLHTGAPRLGSTPSRFDEAMEAVAQNLGEWKWRPQENYPDELASTGDEGLDFIIAKSVDGRRAGKLFLIGQCACGEDWTEKWNDLTLKRLQKWFHPVSVVDPIRVFTTPHILSDGNILDCQQEAGLVFDRVRLVAAASSCGLESALAGWTHDMRLLTKLIVRSTGSELPTYQPPFTLAAVADRG